MLDHIGLAVRDFGRSVTFYRRALAPLGVHTVLEGEGWVMLGKDGKPQFWIGTREAVRAFHRAALAAGGRDNGAPGLRPKYHPNYYGGFVFDPDGHNIEAVCHAPE
jgi:catechol 2,3-dioxygenase-like lactoylglutathione lyase family enzyme